MTDHPITPPPELVEQWNEEAATAPMADQRYIAIHAARWGADQELEACCDAIYLHEDQPLHGGTAEWLRAARRPKPPSLKEQALAELAEWENVMDIAPHSPIRRALEQLDD